MQRNGFQEFENIQSTWIQKLAFYGLLGGVVQLGLELWLQSYLVQAQATANIIFYWGPGYSKCFSVGALATVLVISSLVSSCNRCHILLGS
jgi:hypothetical protein